MAHHRHPKDIGIARMDHDADDMSGVFQSEVFPAAAAVFAAPDAAESFGDIAAHRVLAFAGVEDVFIRWRYGDSAHASAEIFIGNVFPVAAAVGGLPDAAAGGGHVEELFVFIGSGYGAGAAAAEGANEAVFGGGEEDGIGFGG
ncbi:hypothetical protein KJS93_12865 [Flavihumibacter fluvii]|nr:hypothetical protein [Flavihumibacter fluvii]ULQ54864.1 hypothetical protein KJS93_12865 [Flavihumibacter fluvii]